MRRTLVVGALALLLSGCAAETSPVLIRDSAPAVWTIDTPLEPEATTIEIQVSRLACSGGTTGDVLPPVVTYESDRILVKAAAVPLPDGMYGCPGNDTVAQTVTLTEPLGERQLIDETCLSEPAVSTSFCSDNGIRWSPDTN